MMGTGRSVASSILSLAAAGHLSLSLSVCLCVWHSQHHDITLRADSFFVVGCRCFTSTVHVQISHRYISFRTVRADTTAVTELC